MNDRWNALKAEVDFRRKVIRRLYPQASFRSTHGGFFWDRTQPPIAMVILDKNDSHGVHVDEELTLLARAMDIEMRKEMPFPLPDMSDSEAAKNNHFFDMLVAAACDDDLWEQDFVQDAYHRMMGISALDRLVDS